MESFHITSESGRTFDVRIQEADGATPGLVKTLVEIDLQTFAESTFSTYTAAAFLQHGAVFLLSVDDRVIGSCVCMRTWDRPTEALVLSLGIRPGWRGRGLGQRFLRGVLDRLEARGLHALRVLVGSDNRRAIRVYEDVGFERVGVTTEDVRSGEALLLLRAKLNPVGVVTAFPTDE